ncbi:MAG: cyclic nucleotide-binding domain-containing protein [Chloroflexota bacterium]|nr:cyclic nucleotide-binding domain-containing protein [Chloroflexota bacterium]
MSTDPKLLRSFACFHNLSDEQVNAIAQISNSVCYSKGYVLFKQDDPGDFLYLLIEGDVEVFYENAETGAHRVDTVSSEEVVGCAAMVPPYIYTATEKCLSDVEVLEIKTEELRGLIQKDPQLGLRLQEYIIRTLNDRVLELRRRAFA